MPKLETVNRRIRPSHHSGVMSHDSLSGLRFTPISLGWVNMPTMLSKLDVKGLATDVVEFCFLRCRCLPPLALV